MLIIYIYQIDMYGKKEQYFVDKTSQKDYGGLLYFINPYFSQKLKNPFVCCFLLADSDKKSQHHAL